MHKTVLTFLEHQPFWCFIILMASMWLIIKISQAGLLKQYQLRLRFPYEEEDSAGNLWISWTSPVNHSYDLLGHQEVFKKSLQAAKFGTRLFNFEIFAEMMALNGYTNILIRELDRKKEKSPQADQPK